MDSIPHPLSLIEPPPLEGFTPTYLVVLVGIEVGVFSGWCVSVAGSLLVHSLSLRPPLALVFRLSKMASQDGGMRLDTIPITSTPATFVS